VLQQRVGVVGVNQPCEVRRDGRITKTPQSDMCS
jgi:hypothetical protein